jgi:tripartite-type tricarboxylate transporter receptor subunit TctC
MKNMSRLVFGVLLLLLAGSTQAQSNYPEKSIRLMVGFPPGSSVDIVGRVLSQPLAEWLGKAVVVENVAGAAGNIAAERVAKSAPDGYTLALVANAQLVVNPSLYKLAFDPLKDFAPVSQLAVLPHILVVHNAVPARSVSELVALARAQPGGLTFATGGGGSSPHLSAALFKSASGIDIREIPYKGVVAAIPDLLAGRVTMMFGPMPVVLSLAKDGKLRALAVTSLKRSPAAPELPTVSESGIPGFEATLWNGLVAPVGTEAAIVRKLHLGATTALARTEVRSKLTEAGFEIIGNSPAEFAAIIQIEGARWARVIKESGIKAD